MGRVLERSLGLGVGRGIEDESWIAYDETLVAPVLTTTGSIRTVCTGRRLTIRGGSVLRA
jgi:hypothetical protein